MGNEKCQMIFEKFLKVTDNWTVPFFHFFHNLVTFFALSIFGKFWKSIAVKHF